MNTSEKQIATSSPSNTKEEGKIYASKTFFKFRLLGSKVAESNGISSEAIHSHKSLELTLDLISKGYRATLNFLKQSYFELDLDTLPGILEDMILPAVLSGHLKADQDIKFLVCSVSTEEGRIDVDNMPYNDRTIIVNPILIAKTYELKWAEELLLSSRINHTAVQ